MSSESIVHVNLERLKTVLSQYSDGTLPTSEEQDCVKIRGRYDEL